MVSGTDLSGIWAGTVVQGSNTASVFVILDVQGNSITGTYEVPSAPTAYRTGNFTGTLSDSSASITLANHEPALVFDLRLVESNGELMVLGYTVREEGYPKMATITLYRADVQYRLIAGAWIP